MNICLQVCACAQDACLPLLPAAVQGSPGHRLESPGFCALPPLAVGTRLLAPDGAALFAVPGRIWLPAAPHAVACPLLQALAAAG